MTNNVAVATLQQTISTHTLTWSVTPRNSETGLKTFYFNSHAHVERDLYLNILKIITNYFNSHAHVERDYTAVLQLVQIIISTHTLTWSVTMDVYNAFYKRFISTHTLTWSVTTPFLYSVGRFSISTHTLTWSVTNYT